MSDAADTSAEAVERLLRALDRAFLYDGGGEYSTLPEDAAATLRALLAEREAMRADLACLVALHDNNAEEDDGEAWAPVLDAARAALSSTKGTQP